MRTDCFARVSIDRIRVYLGKYLNGPHHSSPTKGINPKDGRGFKPQLVKGPIPLPHFSNSSLG